MPKEQPQRIRTKLMISVRSLKGTLKDFCFVLLGVPPARDPLVVTTDLHIVAFIILQLQVHL